MKISVAVILLFCVTQVLSCSTRPETTASGATSSFPPLTLSASDGRMQLSLRSIKASAGNRWMSVIGLRAYDEELLGVPAARSLGGLWIDGEPVRMIGTNSVRVIDRQSSNDWVYTAVDLTPLQANQVQKFTRHLLHVEPDLFVICDEIVLAEPGIVEVGWWFPAGVVRDSVREEWKLQLPKAGVTARILGIPRNTERLEPVGVAPQPKLASAPEVVCVRSGTTNETIEFRQVIALVPHEQDRRRSLAFKLLESDSAIGVRVHRDGLPTLVAIRKDSEAAEANLTGLKFTGPVAVDVFRSKRK